MKMLNFITSVAATMSLMFIGACHSGGTTSPNSPTSALTITPGWTIPVPPDATVGQSYTASVPAVSGATYTWTVTAGSATLLNTTAAVVTVTPTAAGSITIHCVRNDPSQGTLAGSYTLVAAVGDTLNATPASVSQGQGTILLATYTGTTGTINPGGLSVTSGVGITVTPSSTTTYTLNVDGTDVATATVTVLTYTPKFVYVSNSGDKTISGFSIDGTTGALTALVGSPFALPDANGQDQIATSPDGKFLFAAGTSGSVYSFSINSASGALTSVAGSPFTVGAPVYCVAVDPFDRFVYAHGTDGNIYGFSLNQTTGALTAISGSPWASGRNPDKYGGVIVHPSGLFLYAANPDDNTLTGFAINQSTGALTNTGGSPFDVNYSATLTSPRGLAVDATGAYLFTKGETGTSYLAAMSIDISTGNLTSATGSPYGPLTGSDAYHGLCAHPTKSVIYISFYGGTSADAAVYSLNLGTGALSQVGSDYDLFSHHGSDNIMVDRSGQYAYSTCWSSGVISIMKLDQTTGALLTLAGNPVSSENEDTIAVGNSPDSIAIGGTLQ